ncbi:LytR/AlgR family response regulator transcription factor [Tenacibaculum xiamenense]|uniref:LytR/AlgR family response regulator transcription factor n=1 Tax=Tenacibaculum xiamenense TaxID=1261553 RepID=UPI0038958483
MNSTFLYKQIPYSFRFKKQFFTALGLGCLIAFIMVFLEPFGVYQFESKFKIVIFMGFGGLFSAIYLINARIENQWYYSKGEKWTVKYEILAYLFLTITISFPIHFYNQVFLNNLFNESFNASEYLSHFFWFFGNSILPITLLTLPFYLFFRNKFGEIVTPEITSIIQFTGLNKGELIEVNKQDVLFVKSSENYVNIYFNKEGSLQEVVFRNTLSQIKKQAEFLEQCHRSYLVNTSGVKTIEGNSQNAKIELHGCSVKIPLSKSYFKKLKSVL